MVDAPHDSTTPSEPYDRKLLLTGPKRNEVLELWEVQRYGRDNYGDADYVSVYGMRPANWYARGVRLLGRTVVECTRDSLAARIASRVDDVVTRSPLRSRTLVVDPFAGSANTMYWLVRQMPGTRAVGFELDHRIFESLGTVSDDQTASSIAPPHSPPTPMPCPNRRATSRTGDQIPI